MKNTLRSSGVKILAAALVIVTIALFAGYRSSRSRIISVSEDGGGTAPELALPDIQGKRVRLSDFRGKVVLLDFWATWCAPCIQEAPELKMLQQKYRSRGFTIVGVALDEGGPEEVVAFVEKLGITYPILLSNGNPGPDYPIRAIPYSLLLDRNGRIVKEYLGFKFIDEVEKDVLPLLDQKSP